MHICGFLREVLRGSVASCRMHELSAAIDARQSNQHAKNAFGRFLRFVKVLAQNRLFMLQFPKFVKGGGLYANHPSMGENNTFFLFYVFRLGILGSLFPNNPKAETKKRMIQKRGANWHLVLDFRRNENRLTCEPVSQTRSGAWHKLPMPRQKETNQ